MTQQGKDIRATLGYKVDQNSVAAATQANKNVAASYADIDSAVKALGADVLRLNPQLSTQTSQVNQQATAVDKLANNYRKVATEASNALRFARSDNTIGSGYGTVRSLGSAFGQVAGMGEVGGSVAAIAGLGVELGVLGLAAGAAAVVVRAVTGEVERQTKVQSARLDVEREGAREIANLTTQGIQQRLEEAQERLRIDQEVSRRQTANSLLYDLSIIDKPLEFGRALAGLDPTYNAYQEALAKNKVALEADAALVDVYTAALQNNEGAINAATQAQLDAADLALRFDQMTREEREKQIAQNERDIAILTDHAMATDITFDAMVSLADEVRRLTDETEDLKDVTITYADVLEAEKDAKQALTDQSDAIQKGIEEEQAAQEKLRDATEAVTEAQADLTEALTEHDDNLRRIRNDQTEAEAKALGDRIADEGKAREKAAEDLEKLNEEHGKRVQAIQDRYASSREDAVGNRDALAAYQATKRRDEELKAENENHKDRKDALEAALRDQLKVIKSRYDDQLNSIREAASKAIAAENERYRKQQQNLEVALNKALAAEQFANNRLEALRSENAFRAQYWAGVVETADKRLADAHAALAVSVTQSALLVETVNSQVRSGSSGGGGGNISGFNVGTGGLGNLLSGVSGGSINAAAPRSLGTVLPGAGRPALPSTFRGGMTFSPVITINGANMSPAQMERVVENVIVKSARKAGFVF